MFLMPYLRLKPLQGRCIIAIFMLLSLWVTTEYTAYALNYANQLGNAWIISTKLRYLLLFFGLLSTGIIFYQKINYFLGVLFNLPWIMAFFPIYPPFAYFEWLIKFCEITRSIIWYKSIGIIFVSSLLSLLFYAYFIKKDAVNTSQLHGSARFADSDEVKASGLLDTQSPYAIYMGAWQSDKHAPVQYIRYVGESNTGVFAPSRSGKGAGIILPNLLSYAGNVIVLDLKLENFHYSAGYRQSIGQTILKLDFTSMEEGNTLFNPLLEVRKGINEIKDIQNIVDIIADPHGKGRDDHWSDTANDLMVSIILHVLYVQKDKSLSGVRNFISQLNLNLKEVFEKMLQTIHDPDNQYHWHDPLTEEPVLTHPVVAAGAHDMLKRSESESSGIVSTLKRFLKLYRDPIIAHNTKTSDFRLSDLLDPKKRITLYLHLPPPDKLRLRPLLRIVMTQILNTLTQKWIPPEERDQSRAPILLIMDEFPQLGRLDFFASALAYTAGYGLRTMLICQDLSQIYDNYGHNQSITTNYDVMTIYAPNKLETAQYFSTVLGTKTISREQTNYSGHVTSSTLGQVNTSDQEHKRALLLPDELMRLPFDESIIFKTSHRPIHGKKILCWDDPIFCARTKIKAPVEKVCLTTTNDWHYSEKISLDTEDDLL